MRHRLAAAAGPLRAVRGDRLDQLDLYHRAFDHVTKGHSAERVEVAIRLRPGEEIAEVRVRMPEAALRRIPPEAAVMRIATARDRHRLRPVEVTALRAADGHGQLSHRRSTAAEIHHGGDRNRQLDFSFLGWEILGPAEGASPYLHATADLRVWFPHLDDFPVLVTLIMPEDVTPRSTQGNFAVAYPSRVFDGQRHTNLYFPSAGQIVLSYRCGTSGQTASPWLSIGRAAVVATFVYFICALAAWVDRGDRFVALIATFVAAAGSLWEIVQEFSRFSIYGRGRRLVHYLVLGSQLGTLGLLVVAITALSTTEHPALLTYTGYAALAVAGALGVLAGAGFMLHYQGFWHGFQCDHLGCRQAFRIRRSRPECRYTGRVFCEQHIRSICEHCVHGPDLQAGALHTIGQYGSSPLPCMTDPRADPTEARQA